MTDFMKNRRTYWCKSVEGDEQATYGTKDWNQAPLLDPEVVGKEPNLVSSALEGSDKHKPCLDIDIPCMFAPSSTEGHGHLYFDIELSWEDYSKLLIVLAEVGIADPAWVQHSLDKNQSLLRPPNVRKLLKAERIEAYRATLVEQGLSLRTIEAELRRYGRVLDNPPKKKTWAAIQEERKWNQEF